MKKSFDTLERDIKDMLKGAMAPEGLDVRHETAQRVLTLAKNVATHTLDMVNHQPPVPKDPANKTIRMSELGEPCLRKLMFKWYHPHMANPPYAEPSAPYLPVKFTFGDYIEELTLFMAEEAGHEVHSRQKRVELDLDNGWKAVGHIDAIIDDVVVDVKSAADVSFNKYKRSGLNIATDTFGYRYQLGAYEEALGKEGAFIFVNKHDGELLVNPPYDNLAGLSVITAKSIASVADAYTDYKRPLDALLDPIPGERKVYGEQLGVVCSYCPFKYQCYNGDITGVIEKGRPKYFVTSTLTKEGMDLVSSNPNIAAPSAVIKDFTKNPAF